MRSARCYVSRPLITERRSEHPTGLRIPATEIEQIVTGRIGQLLADPAQLFEAISSQIPDAADQQRLLQRAAEFAATWSEQPDLKLRGALLLVIQRIDVRSTGSTSTFCQAASWRGCGIKHRPRPP